MSDSDSHHELREAEGSVESLAATYRPWVIPILACLQRNGGSAGPKTVEDEIGEAVSNLLSEAQWRYVLKKNRIRFARNALREAGMIGGERGVWEILSKGEAYLQAHGDVPIAFPDEIPALSEAEMREPETETVLVTHDAAYRLPVLRVLTEGNTTKQTILDAVADVVSSYLLQGDQRLMPMGLPVWRYKAGWALSNLKADGSVMNPARGIWQITDSGRELIEGKLDPSSWSFTEHQSAGSRTRVVVDDTVIADQNEEAGKPLPFETTEDLWSNLRAKIGDSVHHVLSKRVRPDLAPTPDPAIARNVILYGPPGTGKTFIAKQAALALTGQPSSQEGDEDARWRMLQFHPSMGYEEFVIGLRPDLEHKELRYRLKSGPFLKACKDASDDPENFHVLIIDEINRGDPARIFGELLYALEYRGETIELTHGRELAVPPNLVVIGTMNSVDRSVALVDYALRRRFGFVRVDPTPSLIAQLRDGAQAAAAAEVLHRFNEWISRVLSHNHVIGHSVFLNPIVDLDHPDALEQVWKLDVAPLLEEYFFDDADSLSQARREWKQAVIAAKGSASRAGEESSPSQGDFAGSA